MKKKYVISIDEDENAKAGVLIEVGKNGVMTVIDEKYEIKQDKLQVLV